MSAGCLTKQRLANFAIGLWLIALISYPMAGIAALHWMGTAYGEIARLGTGLAVFLGFFLFLKYLSRWSDKIDGLQRAYIRETYRGIYRVKAPPVSEWTWSRENIRIGDYGWEARKWNCDDLIYLHGLEEQWGVVWIGGFRREDIEYVGPKPVSEYDWKDFEYDGPKPGGFYRWGGAKAKTPCPFPVSTAGRKIWRWRFPV